MTGGYNSVVASLFTVGILGLAALGAVKVTEPATSAELAKALVFHMDGNPGSYTDKHFDEHVLLYVFNGTDQNWVNPKFEAAYTSPNGKHKGIQTSVKVSSTLPGSFSGILPSRLTSVVAVTFKVPIGAFYYGRKYVAKLVSAEKYKKDAPLTDPNAMRQFFLRSTGPEITKAFKAKPELAKVRDSGGMPPMGMAILTGAVGNVKALEAAGLKLTGPFPNKLTALHLACDSSVEMITYVKSKLPAWTKDAQGFNPLFHAIYSIQPTNLKALSPTKKQLAEKCGPYSNTALHAAVSLGSSSMIKTLMQYGPDPNALNVYGEPPIASSYRMPTDTIDKTITLIKPSLSVKIGKEKHSLLHYAVVYNKWNAVPALMKHGLNPRTKNGEGKDCFDLLQSIDHPVDRAQMKRLLEGKKS